jgi:hypothetical protein
MRAQWYENLNLNLLILDLLYLYQNEYKIVLKQLIKQSNYESNSNRIR